MYVGVEEPVQHAYLGVLALGFEQEQERGMLTQEKQLKQLFFSSEVGCTLIEVL